MQNVERASLCYGADKCGLLLTYPGGSQRDTAPLRLLSLSFPVFYEGEGAETIRGPGYHGKNSFKLSSHS